MAPYDPDDRLARVLHRGASPQQRPLPDYVIPLGRTFGLPMNGAVSNLSGPFGETIGVLGRELRSGNYDVVHVHEPNVPVVSWYAAEAARAPVVGTFHTYSTSAAVNKLAANFFGARRLYSKLSARIAVSEAARWTAQRFYGGQYRIVPNGVDPVRGTARSQRRLRGAQVLFVGRAEERKGLRAAARLRGAARCRRRGAPHGRRSRGGGGRAAPARAGGRGDRGARGRRREVAPAGRGRPALRAVARRRELRHGAHRSVRLGTPVVASDIAGYREVARDGQDSVLVPVGDAVALGETLRSLAFDPARRAAMADAARERAERFAWPHVAREVEEVYEEALSVPQPEGAWSVSPSGSAWRPRSPALAWGRSACRRSSPKDPAAGRRRAARTARRVLVAAGAVAGAGLAVLALRRLGVESLGRAIVAATPVWVLVAFALMCASMLLRAEAWHAILRAALPGIRVRAATLRGTMIGC